MTTNPPSGDNIKANLPEIKGHEVLELLGRGRMSSVWKARQISSGRLVAVKVLSESFSRNPECINQLKADIKFVTNPKHDCIVQIYDIGQAQADGCYYLISEYISGYNLGGWLRRSGRLPESDALTIAHFVADALRLAWNKVKLAHGDIKPDNILIDNEGTTKITDLGLAPALRMAGALDDPKQSLPADELSYMSPEIISGQGAFDCRSDIYSLGATLYHLLTGQTALVATESAVAGERQSKAAVTPGLTVGSARLIRKMMSKAPGERYQKWEEVIADLTRLEHDEQQEPAEEDAAAPITSASDKSGRKPVLVKVASSSGTKPSRFGRYTRVFAKKKIIRRPTAARIPGARGVHGAPAALPRLKKPAISFMKSARRSLYIAIAFHVILLLSAGTVIISRVYYNRETTFVGQPPPMRAFEPRKLEHQVKVQKRQRSSSRPSMAPRLVASKGSSFALPDIKVDSKSVKTSFSPKFSTVGGMGMGVGLGTGYGLGGFAQGQGVSTYNFFGIKGRADRVAILVDVSESMVEDIRDGEAGYLRVRDKIGQVIDELSEQALFNVIVFADAASACSTNLMIGSLENKQRAKVWLAPFNTKGNVGLSSGNLQQSSIGLRAIGGTTRLDLALTGAFEQGADTILIISDGMPRVKRALTDQEKDAWDEKVVAWERENAAAFKARRKAESRGGYSEKKVWVPGTKREEGRPATEGHWDIRQEWGGHLPALTPRPAPAENLQWWTIADFIEHFTLLYKELYEKKGGKKAPVIHCIGYCIDETGGSFLKGLPKQFKGNYRLVGGHIKTNEPGKSATSHPTASQSKRSSKNKDLDDLNKPPDPDDKSQPGQLPQVKLPPPVKLPPAPKLPVQPGSTNRTKGSSGNAQ